MYKVTIQVLREKGESGYARYDEVYEQIVDELDIEDLIAVVNGLEKKVC